jgi:two-component system chemotaxis response regulator CheB
MTDTRVMVVDDSAAMRALFCDILDNAPGVVVCGTASNADEAREKLDELRPDVLTLDVEMPGKSGLDFLAELMEERPLPVIMLSSIAQAGTGTARRALELGAVHCFPKPLHSSREEFDATVKKLGGIVLKAASGELKPGGGSVGADVGTDYRPSDRLVALACGADGIAHAQRLIAAYPVNCPPTILLLEAESDAVESAIAAMHDAAFCQVEKAIDGSALAPGCVHVAFEKSRHVVVEASAPPRLRMVERDPVAGCRPSTDLLFGSIARASVPAIGVLLVGSGRDGAKGLQIFAGAGYETCAQIAEDGAPSDRIEAVRALGVKAHELRGEELAQWVLKKTAL